MTKTPQTEADELVEMFYNLDSVDKRDSVTIAILHVERLIEVLEKLQGDDLVDEELASYQQVLQILKSKNP